MCDRGAYDDWLDFGFSAADPPVLVVWAAVPLPDRPEAESPLFDEDPRKPFFDFDFHPASLGKQP